MARFPELKLDQCLTRIPDWLQEYAERQQELAGYWDGEFDLDEVRSSRSAEVQAAELLVPIGFRFQVPIYLPGVADPRSDEDAEGKGFIMDFFHRRARLCVEIDGMRHKPERDNWRDKLLTETVGIETVGVMAIEVEDQAEYGERAFWFRDVLEALEDRQ